MKCSNNNCSNDAMASKTPINISIGQVACSEYCKEQTELQNVYEEEHDYFDRCKGLNLQFDTVIRDSNLKKMIMEDFGVTVHHRGAIITDGNNT